MASNDKESSPTTRTPAKQDRDRVRTGTPRSGKPVSTLSDRVGKRGWTKKACLECHRRKIKCDMTTKSRCTSCEKFDVPCSVNEYRRRRNKEKRSKIDELESNIERMENVFEKLGLLRPVDDLPGTPVSFPQSHPSWDISEAQTQAWDALSESGSDHSNHSADPSMHPPNILVDSRLSSAVADHGNIFLENLACSSMPVNLTKDRSINRASGAGASWHQAKSNSRDYHAKYTTTMSCLPVPDPDEPFDGTSSPRTFYPLPGIAETMVLFLEFLENFNTFCPLFQPVSLLSIYDEDSSINPDQADHWACINVVLALAHTMRSRPSDVAQSNHQISWMFMKNALQVANSLCNGPPTLWAAQALLGMTIFLLGTLNDKPCDLFVTSALRITHDLLLRNNHQGIVCEDNLQHCRMVFWIAYCLDRDISLRFGRSLDYTDEYVEIEFSPGLSSHHCTTQSDQEQIDFDVFRSYCELSVIKGQVCKFFCSAKTSKQLSSALADSVARLDEKLRGWKASVPKTFRPDVQDTASFPKSKASLLLLSLHFSYFNCLLSLHRTINSLGSGIYTELARSYSSGLLSEDIAHFSGILCQNAARASIKLIKHMPGNTNPSMVGILVHYLVAATEMLSKQIINNPKLACDIRMIDQVERFLSSVVLSAPNEEMHRVVEYCAEQRFLAETAVNGLDAQLVV